MRNLLALAPAALLVGAAEAQQSLWGQCEQLLNVCLRDYV